jgi:phospholipid-translocating ATPase
MGKIEVLTKGADSAIENHLVNYEKNSDALRTCKEHILRYSEMGLRTLMLAKRTLSVEEYEDWAVQRKKADEQGQEAIDEVNK